MGEFNGKYSRKIDVLINNVKHVIQMLVYPIEKNKGDYIILLFDCQMKNLEGNFIQVKLIFGRTDTTSEQDFRFVFMVQNIHEEFVCVCYGMTIAELKVLAEEIRQSIANSPFETIGSLTCSVGLSSVNQDDSAKDAFIRLDNALYNAKNNGRNCISINY